MCRVDSTLERFGVSFIRSFVQHRHTVSIVTIDCDYRRYWLDRRTKAFHLLLLFAWDYLCPLCPAADPVHTTSKEFLRHHLFVAHDGCDYFSLAADRYGVGISEVWKLVGERRRVRERVLSGLPSHRISSRRQRAEEHRRAFILAKSRGSEGVPAERQVEAAPAPDLYLRDHRRLLRRSRSLLPDRYGSLRWSWCYRARW